MNFAENLTDLAAKFPFKRAVVFPFSRDSINRVGYTHLTYRQLDQESDSFAHGLTAVGVQERMRVSFLVEPGLDFLPLIYALFKLGAIPVLIDPGMGKQNLLNCIARSKPKAFIGITRAHLARLLFPKYFRTIKINVSTKRLPLLNTYPLDHFRNQNLPFRPVSKQSSDVAAIVFTTGSTGPPKGVVFTHGMFCAQTNWIKDVYQITPEDIDMPGFSLFAMFSVAIGMTAVIPDMDPTRPAHVDPRKIVEAINNHGVTFSFGSPALWNNVSLYCVKKKITLPSIKKILMAGAPIPPYLHQRLLENILSAGSEIHTPYGATESLLVSTFSGRKVLSETMDLTRNGHGYCVGNPLPGVRLKVIKVRDDPISCSNEIEELPHGMKGEIIVQSDVVSPSYFDLPAQDKLHKINHNAEPGAPPWHRIGDIGYLDDQNRLWFCGRKTHRVETAEKTMYTVCCEAIFNEHPHVYRSALIGIGTDRYRQIPAVVIEPAKGHFPKTAKTRQEFKRQLRELGQQHSMTQEIKHFLFYRSFPVDIRHNAKIFREQLAEWGHTQIKLQ